MTSVSFFTVVARNIQFSSPPHHRRFVTVPLASQNIFAKRKPYLCNQTSNLCFSSKLKSQFDGYSPSKQFTRNFQTTVFAHISEKEMGKSSSSGLVNKKRARVLKQGEANAEGPVLYWCQRDQRFDDNWALLHAAELAVQRSCQLAVVFTLRPGTLQEGARQAGFMLRGLQEFETRLEKHGIPFALLEGSPSNVLPSLASRLNSPLIVTDMSPLREHYQAEEQVGEELEEETKLIQVDAHNIVPVWCASDKKEVGARTLRARLHRQFGEFLVEFPEMPTVKSWDDRAGLPPRTEWKELINRALKEGSHVPEVSWAVPGESAAKTALQFFLQSRLSLYQSRNDPCKPQGLSGLSPYFHFGQISPQRAILEAHKVRSKDSKAVDEFVEEAAVRRELADNFCYYEPNYDQLSGQTYEWATQTLADHAKDKRPYLYTEQQLEKAQTHDSLWNAAQNEVVYGGKIHGFMRMYWAKKILEWTKSPEEALRISLMLNDKYSIDGRDPNGFVGCMWSVVGVHDQGWKEREVFGKIRYMNYDGCKRKFSIDGYVARVRRLVAAVKKGDTSSEVNPGGFKVPSNSASANFSKGSSPSEPGTPKQMEKLKKDSKAPAPTGPLCDPETLQRMVRKAVEAADATEQGSEEGRAVDALKAILKENISAEVVVKAQVGKQVKKLCKHENQTIAQGAKAIVTHWQKVVIQQGK